MSKTTADYLRDLLQELDDIVAFTIEGEAAFMRDVKTQKAVIHSYEVIGEIGKRLPCRRNFARCERSPLSGSDNLDCTN